MFDVKWANFLGLAMLGWLWTVPAQSEASKAETPAAVQPTVPEQSGAVPPAAGSTAPSEQLKALRERIERYWEARQSRDVKTLYELESASRPGGWLKLEHAMGLQGMPVRKVKVEDARIEGDKGITRISAEVMIGTIGWTKQTIADSWVLLDGQWYHETSRD
ncbi:MAG: hypothetical protein IPP10_04015 [Candidatus Competibacteraceae bacterium]|nr:hypothetical protein [Candidatus Competibacteraceae bacterium]MBK8897671.1 hypothetical protein [Candidatus Competibacteraceae bacterium]MBK8963816.1 hypothetical protein [Candidatus Competibacteraceae bacterium]MBK9950705.1 hypothetical protein [Candidatus Competibacteraceae bacterium]